MNIRVATPDDAAVVARIHIDSWRAAYRGLVPDEKLAALDYASRTERFRRDLAAPDPCTCVIEDAGEIAGFCTFGACRDSDTTPQIGEIWGIYLAPGHWRKGLGRALALHAEQQLAARGCRRITLWVFADNRSARGFYEAMGYQSDGQNRMIEVGRPLAVVRYAKPLREDQ